jgi:hypothetical protein
MIMNRRRFLYLTGAATALILHPIRIGARAAVAQGGTDLANLGLPEITITRTEQGYAVSPETTPAGWTLVTFENQLPAGDTSADVMRIPEGETLESLFSQFSPDPTVPPPAWVYEVTFAGAPWAHPGGSAQALILLEAGDWVVFSPEPVAPAVLTVTEGGTPVAQPDLAADVEVTMQDMAFVGLEGPLSAGPQVWKVTNAGPQPHLMSFSSVPTGTTQAQLVEMLTASMSATPTGDPAGIVPPTTGGTATLSNGQDIYLALDLAVGTYGAVCFFSDRDTGMPHVMLGMAQVFTVE